MSALPKLFRLHQDQARAFIPIIFFIHKNMNDFTPLDAYYCGIAGRPAEADEWGLSPSEHEY